jgi:uncharacterized membrane protein
MEALLILGGLGLLALGLVSPVLALGAYVRAGRLQTELEGLRAQVAGLEASLARLTRRTAEKPAIVAAGEPVVAPPTVMLPPPAPVAHPTTPVARPAAAPPKPQAPDLATNLGPKLLVAVGALAVFASLGFFVKYAWDNDWVGPTGRVLSGAIFSLGLITAGIRLLGREYRPLGQGLAGAGLAGLYTSAFGAHGFYDLISRGAAGTLLVIITACALALASRLDARLLAGLAWVGGYLTPILLSTGEDRALSLFLYLFLLDAGALLLDRAKPWPETMPLAFSGTMLLYAGWFSQFFRPERFEVAAFGLALFTALFALGMAKKERGVGLGIVLAFGTVWVVAMSGLADRPVAILALLVALAGIAILMQRRWAWAEATGVATAALAVLAWHDAFGEQPGHDTKALLLAIVVSGIYLLSLVVRGLLLGHEVGEGGTLTHLVGAGLLWSMLFRIFYETNPTVLGLASVALAVVYLALGLALLRAEAHDERHTRTALGIAASFLTIAIPVQLGLHGITLAWAIEGLVLLGLGVRFASERMRAFGYAVLVLAVVRLFARHLPLHAGPFTAFVNPAFGIWLCVIGALGVSLVMTRRLRDEGLESFASPASATLGLLLLFGVLTGETQALFHQQALAGVVNARLMGGLALSVLWSMFATGLLASGLGLRNRPLFFAAYALFGITALKVVFVDLAELHTLYRILSFLALGVLLMAGAYLNIRFRARLLPREPGQ